MKLVIERYGKSTVKVVALLSLIYLFLLSITLIGDSFKIMGREFAESIIRTTSNPILGIVIGIFTTSLVQSSSLTTSLVVGLAAAGAFGSSSAEAIKLAIPIIMGANIGTSVTNLLVSIGHIKRSDEFERALGASIVHDFFNVLSVLIIFPLQYFFNILGISATVAAGVFENVGGLKIINPIGEILKPISQAIISIFPSAPWISIIIAFIILFFALRYIVKVMKSLVLHKIELFFDQYIFKTTFRALIVGMLFTAIIQSSSITTSLVIPLAAAGVLSLKRIFPYDLGANIGTTITAFLASLAINNIIGVTIAFGHLFFNLIGIAIFLPLRAIPIKMATVFAHFSVRHRFVPLLYILFVFFLIPLLLITLMR